MTSNSVDASLDKCGEGVTFTLPAGISGRLKILDISDVGVLSKKREIDVRCFRGEAVVKYGQNQEKTLKPGDHKEFDNAIEVTATGDAVFKVYCDENHYPYLFLLSGLLIPVIIEALGEPEPTRGPSQPQP
jgi:hypothetical protein